MSSSVGPSASLSSSSAAPPVAPPWKCKYCTWSFRKEPSLGMHIERYHKVEQRQGLRVMVVRGRRRMWREVRCDICGLSSANFEAFLHHRLCHNLKHNHVPCKHCGKLFQTEAYYKMHKKVHVLPSSYTHTTQFDLRRHRRRAHPELTSEPSDAAEPFDSASSSGAFGPGSAGTQEDDPLTLLPLNEDQINLLTDEVAPPKDGNIVEEYNTADQIKMVVEETKSDEPPVADQEGRMASSGAAGQIDLGSTGTQLQQGTATPPPPPQNQCVASGVERDPLPLPTLLTRKGTRKEQKGTSQPAAAVFIMKPVTEAIVISHDEGSVTFSGSKGKGGGGGTKVIDVKFDYGRMQIPDLELYYNTDTS